MPSTYRQHNGINVINFAGASCGFGADLHRLDRFAGVIKIEARGQRSSQNIELTGVQQAFRQGDQLLGNAAETNPAHIERVLMRQGK